MFRICLAICLAFAVVNGRSFHERPYLTRQLINAVNTAKTTWTAGPSKFMSWPEDRLRGIMGVLPGYAEQHKLLPVLTHEVPQALPDNFDARTQWPNCESLKEVRDQGACGSCWAFGAVEAMTDRICIYSKGATKVHISAEDLVSCCDECGFGCEGGFPQAAWQYYQGTGIVTGGNYNSSQGCQPYEIAICDHHTTGKYQPCGSIQPTPACSKKCEDSYPTPFAQDKHHGQSTYAVGPDQTQIQTELFTNGPVEAAFTVYADFLTYKSGVYQHTSGSALGGHAVKILGWGVENSTPYWLVANSWNEDWGDQGFFKIRRGNDECGIESGIVAGAPKL